jgi:hypothetical protein
MEVATRPREFDERFIGTVRRVMRRAYLLARDHYDPDNGVDGQIFAFAVYKIAARHFDNEIAEVPGAAVVWNSRGREIRIGEKHLRWNKVGHSERDNIETSFPSRSRSAAIAADFNVEQLALGLVDSDPTHWIIAHTGNAIEGLRTLYLAAPIESRNGQVTGWLRWIAIYDGQQPDEPYPALPEPGPIEPQPADLGDFDLRLRESEDDAAHG